MTKPADSSREFVRSAKRAAARYLEANARIRLFDGFKVVRVVLRETALLADDLLHLMGPGREHQPTPKLQSRAATARDKRAFRNP